MIRDSLLARARMRPASRAASVAARPTAPVTALRTTSQSAAASSATASGPASILGSWPGRSPRSAAWAVIACWRAGRAWGLATATVRTRNSRACAARRAADDFGGLGADRAGRAEQDDVAAGRQLAEGGADGGLARQAAAGGRAE